FYAKAQNLSRKLRDAYDAALADFDVLVMPTLPLTATPLPPADAPREVSIQRAFEIISNTAPFNATGHPAMSVPCAPADSPPIGGRAAAKLGRSSVNATRSLVGLGG